MSTTENVILTTTGLSVDFWSDDAWVSAVEDVSFTVSRGETLAIVGESGSGKSTAAMAVLDLLPGNARVRGSIRLHGAELIGAKASAIRSIRGREIAMIFQEPMTAMNPVYTVGFQIVEVLRSHGSITPKAGRARAIELLTMVGIPEPERRVDAYPHQLSGGQRQRSMIAMALAAEPKLLIADEPTTALDVTVQAEILELIRDLAKRIDAGVLLITHDMGVVADLADRVLVMHHGAVVETGLAAAVFAHPREEYTRSLLAAVPHLGAGAPEQAPTEEPERVPEQVLDMVDTVIEYPGRGSTPAFRAIDGVSLDVRAGEVLGLVGESGSGKSTIGRAIVGLLTPTAGTMTVAGVSMVGASRADIARAREQVAIVFQDPGSSLNPRWPIGDSIGEPLKLRRKLRGPALHARVEELLDQVHLSTTMRNRYPHELSGGQRQRVGIARALALTPRLLVADEPTSALDVSVQAAVLALLAQLQREQGFACLFISHDLAVVEEVSDRIAVLHAGKLVETGPTEQLLAHPTQDYTRRLLAAVPVPDPALQRERREARLALLEG